MSSRRATPPPSPNGATASSYHSLISQPATAPSRWKASCTHTESTLHQLSPYIGKLKSSIAQDLVAEYSRKGDLVADVFCGSGTVPLESVALGRQSFAADASAYAITLTKGKLTAPRTLRAARAALDSSLAAARSREVNTQLVPKWVRAFYHPDTLREMMQLLEVLRKRRNHFLLACLLGISHHQRPGFLSFPSSHLVPYLRSKKYPRAEYPELYEYRSLVPRLKAKVARALKRSRSFDSTLVAGIRRSTVQFLTPPRSVHCFITSPPYMNALDYGRDNRLRNWLLSGETEARFDARLSDVEGFRRAMTSYARIISTTLVKGGRCVFVVGEKTTRTGNRYPSEVLSEIIEQFAPCLTIKEIISDYIPDIRRSRRHLTGVKLERILVYERSH